MLKGDLVPSTGKSAGEESGGAPRKPENSGSGNIIRPRSFTAPPPDPAEALYYEGMAAYQHRNWNQALERFGKLKELQPGRPGLDALLDEVRWFLQLQATIPAAAEPVDDASSGRGGAPARRRSLWQVLAIALLAVVAMGALLLVAFGERLPWNGVAAQETQDLYARAETRLAVGDYEGAQAVYRKLLELSPYDPEAQLGLDRAQRQQLLAQGYAAAEAAIAEENWERAASELANVLAIDSHYAGAQAKADFVAQRQRLANLYADGSRLYDLAQWEDAAAQFERIRELDSTYRGEAVAEFLFVCYLSAGENIIISAGVDVAQAERAVNYYAKALAIHPRNRIAADAHRLASRYVLAVGALAKSDRLAARSQLQALIDEDPGYADRRAAQLLYQLTLEDAQTAAAAKDVAAALDLFRLAQRVPVNNTEEATMGEEAVLAYTPTPTTAPTRTTAPTATPPPFAMLKNGPAVIRTGPGLAYAPVGEATVTMVLQITGRLENNLWYRVGTSNGLTGWLAAAQLDFGGDANAVPVVTPPAPPTRAAATPQPVRTTSAPEACLEGNVRDAAGGVPLTGWAVTLTDSAGMPRTTRSSSTGGYRFTGLMPGTYTVLLTVQSGWQSISPPSQAVTIGAGATCVLVDFWLQRGDALATPAR